MLQKIAIHRVHTVHAALAVLDTLALTLEVSARVVLVSSYFDRAHEQLLYA